MKKQNNRFRNNGGSNNGYTLNYKFDSVSIAGKISGTALDLIRRYNDLAKEAQASGNYVDMEIYRQYAEHYRKIVTEINERRQSRQEQQNRSEDNTENVENENENEDSSSAEEEVENKETQTPIEPIPEANGYVETLPAVEKPIAKNFKVVEITEEAKPEEEVKPKRTTRKRTCTPRKTKKEEEKIAEAQ